MATVSLNKLTKQYGAVEVVHGIDLEISNNEFVVLVGPSGCGKSTVLRMIAGLEEISAGEICIDKKVVNELEAKERDIAMVFQDYALYPHMSVFDNIAFGLRYRGVKKAEINERVLEAAGTLGISDLLTRRPKQLSGGQRQRVAMGRCIVRKPKVFLFDEPLSNLDAKMRVVMRSEIKSLHKRVETTCVYVTHDQVEAMTLADRIVVMNEGRIEQVGTPDEVYRSPASIFVAGFIGSPAMNFLPVTIRYKDTSLFAEINKDISFPLADTHRQRCQDRQDQTVILGIRYDGFTWSEHIDEALITTIARDIEPLGSETLAYFKLANNDLVCRLTPGQVTRAGEPLYLSLQMEQIHLFDADSGKAL